MDSTTEQKLEEADRLMRALKIAAEELALFTASLQRETAAVEEGRDDDRT